MLYRFKIDLSDIDRGVYETLDFRIAQHPSETPPYLITRVLAFALSFEEGLEFSAGGLADPEAPALRKPNLQGGTDLWIEIGNPSPRKLHKASKSASRVIVYTYKNPEVLRQQILEEKVHRADEVRIISFDADFLTPIENLLGKSNVWTLLIQQGQIDLQIGEVQIVTHVKYQV